MNARRLMGRPLEQETYREVAFQTGKLALRTVNRILDDD